MNRYLILGNKENAQIRLWVEFCPFCRLIKKKKKTFNLITITIIRLLRQHKVFFIKVFFIKFNVLHITNILQKFHSLSFKHFEEY